MALYVSHYALYPIFEPAEGGYYYDGIRLIRSRSAPTLEIAKSILKKEAELLEFMIDMDGRRAGDEDFYHRHYIGEGEFIIIECKKGKHESGWQPYC